MTIIEKCVNEDRFIELLNTYSTDNKTGTAMRDIFSNMKSSRMIVPVVGMQGMGKSTLINSIIGGDMLPVDADETTCVPVEVRYGEREYAEVFTKNSSKISACYTADELREYVDNNCNPANEKQVEKIVLYEQCKLLKNGLTIVDLPGVGSITQENQETTQKYVEKLSAAIFVIPTVPTVRRQEVCFIQLFWNSCPHILFVQNIWGESSEEVDESVEYNTKILKGVSKKINSGFDGEISLVNANKALSAALEGDEVAMENSGLNSLKSKLARLSDNWQEQMNKSFIEKLFYSAEAAISVVSERIEDLDKTKRELENQRREKYEKFCEDRKQENKKIRSIEDFLDEKKREVRGFAKEQSENYVAEVRSQMYHLIDNGVVDGDQLSSAFENRQNEVLTNVINAAFEKIQEIQFELTEMLEELGNVEFNNNMSGESVSFYNGDAFKFEKSFTVFGAIGGGLLGSLVIGSIGGPIGVILAIGITAIGGLLGQGAKKAKQNQRAEKAKQELSSVFREIQTRLYDTIVTGFNEFFDSVENMLEEYKKKLRAEEQRLEDSLDSVSDENQADKPTLRNDLEYLKKFEKELKEYA